MTKPSAPLFLEHRTYRRRRLLDAVRLLPFVGAILFLAPALMPRAAQMDLSGRVVYIFAAWSLLILAIALSSRVARGVGAETEADAEADAETDRAAAPEAPVADRTPGPATGPANGPTTGPSE